MVFLKNRNKTCIIAINLIGFMAIIFTFFKTFSFKSFKIPKGLNNQPEQEKWNFKIFVYDVSEKFDQIPKRDMLQNFKKDPSNQQYYHEIFLTDFFKSRGKTVKKQSLESIFTNDPAEADLFFVPYMTGAIGLTTGIDTLKSLNKEMENYLKTFEEGYYWKRNHGKDHVFIEAWIPAFVKDHFKNSIFIGQDFFDTASLVDHDFESIIMVPYIGHGDFNIEQKTYLQAEKNIIEKRSYFASFSGSWNIHDFNMPVRTGLKKTIEHHQSIHNTEFPIMTNEMKSRSIVQLNSSAVIYSNSDFCFVPIGDSSQSKRLFDVLFYLCIPVVISDDILLPYLDHIPWQDILIFLPDQKFRQLGENNEHDEEMSRLFKPLMEMSLEEKIKRRELILKYRQLLAFEPFYPQNEGDDGITMLMYELQHQANRFRRWKGFKERLNDLKNKK